MTWTIQFWAAGVWNEALYDTDIRTEVAGMFDWQRYERIAQSLADSREAKTGLPHRIRRLS